MPDSWVNVQGFDRVMQRLNKVVNGISAPQVEGVLMKGAKVVKKAVDRRIGSKFKVKTGHLAGSTRSKKSKYRGTTFASVFAAIDRSKRGGAPHAHLLEFGTSKMPAHPFFRPAVDETQGEVSRVVEDGIKQLLGEASK